MNGGVVLVVVIVLVSLSALCSGLNVALMSLSLADLRRQRKLGNRDAKAVLPLRRNSNLSLASILLTNVAVISANSLVLEARYNGWIAGIVSTLLIVLFGEIFPQAIFTRHALSFTSRLVPLLRLMIIITYPIAKPLQLLLDRLLGHEAAHLQSRRELGILISEHQDNTASELDEDEVEIIRGALLLSEKRVRDILTPIDKVYWLLPADIVDDRKIDEIKANGHSRIPVFNADKTVCYGILLVKQLVDMDFDEHPARVDELPLHPIEPVGSMTALDTMFRTFIGARTHLIPVEKDDRIIGVVTIEDLIEEIIGHEIEDETDARRIR